MAIVAISDFFSQQTGELRRCLIDWPKGPQGLDQKPLPLHPGVRALQHVSGKTLLMCHCDKDVKRRYQG